MPSRHEAKFFTVRLRRNDIFPLDMLRFDEAYPESASDAALIEKLILQEDTEILALPKVVEVRLGSRRTFAPEVKRWESFGVRVVEPVET